MIKKFSLMIFLVVMSLGLWACENPPKDYDSLITNYVISIPSEVTTSSIDLPTSIVVENETFDVSWTSNKPVIISTSGNVSRPTHASGDVSVILTAVVTKGEFIKTLTYNITVKALPLVTYTVSFDTDGGSSIANQSVDENGYVVEPNTPTKEGFNFMGWFKEDTFTNPWVFNTDKVTTNITLYAKWETIIIYTVTFEDHDGSILDTVEVEAHDNITQPLENPEKLGYEFVEWQLNGVTFDFETEITGNITLKPVFSIITYNISYWIPIGSTLSVNGDETYTILTSPVLKTVSQEGMVFVGWFTKPENGEQVTSIPLGSTGDVTLYAILEVDEVLPTGTLIYTAEDLLNIINNGATGEVHLMNDIDMNGITLTGSSKTFDGVFNGHNHTITGAVINASGNKMGFLFKEVLKGGVVKNVRFNNSIHHGGGTSESSAFISAFAQGGSRFENITFNNVSVIHQGSYAALLFGDVINDSTETTITIRNITVINDDSHWIEGSSYVGGLIGAARKVVTIDVENVYFDSKVAAPNQAAGAIMGRLNAAGISLTVRNIVVKGSVSSGKNVGAILGTNISGSTIIADKVFISDIIQTSGTNTVKIGVGNLPSGSNAVLTNLYYNSETTQFVVGSTPITMPEGVALTTLEITPTWFSGSGFDHVFFKVLNGTIMRRLEDTGPVVETGFNLSTAQVKKYYLVGESLDLANLSVYATYSDGSSVLLESSAYTVNSSLFNNTQSGIYDISITYKDQTKSFSVEVVSVTNILAEDLLMKQTYLIGQALNFDNLVIKAILDDGSYLKLNSNEYTIDTSAVNFSVAGSYQITITYKTFDPVHINIDVHESDISNPTTVNLYVDRAHLGFEGETIQSKVMFKTVKAALQYLINQNYTASTVKIIHIADGIYREKITVTLPNTIFLGESEENTIITYDAASGKEQPNGSTWGTQGSATVAIKSSATNFMAKNLTFQNDFNYNQSTLADRQGVALVNEADQVIFYQVAFKGYQDTLYAKSGRQYYLDVYIEGVVDFIFGNAGPAYFENSTIHSLARSTGVIATNKGYNVSNTALVMYGYVFYRNTFTYEAGVPTGSVDLGRPWDQPATIMYIENTFDSHISARGWTEMSGNLPQNARFYEYMNKDTQNQVLPTTTNGQTLTAESALQNANKDLVFGMFNGQVTFSEEWGYQADLTFLQGLIF